MQVLTFLGNCNQSIMGAASIKRRMKDSTVYGICQKKMAKETGCIREICVRETFDYLLINSFVVIKKIFVFLQNF